MRAVTIIGLFLLLVASNSYGDTANGNLWRSLSGNEKIVFLLAFDEGEAEAADGCATSLRLSRIAELDMPATAQMPKGILGFVCFSVGAPDGFTVRQMRDGIDSFYSDYRNSLLEIRIAQRYVVASVRGNPMTEETLQLLRREAAKN